MAGKDVLSDEETSAIQETVADKPTENLNSSAAENSHQVFDFSSKERVAQTQLQGLSVANERLCADFQTGLEKTFGIRMDVSLKTPEIINVEDCIAALQDDAILNLSKLNISSNESLIVVNAELLSEFINRYFGSQLAQAKASKTTKKLSTTETRINNRLFELFSTALASGWQDIAKIEITRLATEINPDFVQLGKPDDLVVRFVFDIGFADFSDSVTWAFHYSSLEPLLVRHQQDSAKKMGSDADWRGQIYDYLQDVCLDMHVRLPSFEMSLRQVKAFEVGTVIPMESPQDVYLYIEDSAMFHGEYGAYADKKAVSLKQRIEAKTH